MVWNSVSIEYPAAEKKAYDALVTHVAGSLKRGHERAGGGVPVTGSLADSAPKSNAQTVIPAKAGTQ